MIFVKFKYKVKSLFYKVKRLIKKILSIPKKILRLKIRFFKKIIRLIRKISVKIITIFFGIIFLIFVIGNYAYLWFEEEKLLHEVFIKTIDRSDFDILLLSVFGIITFASLFNLFFLIRRFKFKRGSVIYIIIVNIFLLASVVALSLEAYINRHPNLEYNYPAYDTNLKDYSKPLKVQFNVPVRVDKLKPSIVQDWKGKWVWEPYLGINSITRVGKFYPEVTAIPEQRFVVYIAGINKLTDNKEHEYGYVFKAPTLPKLVSSMPADKSSDLKMDGNIVLEMNKRYQELVDFEFKFNPNIEFDIVTSSDNQVVIDPKYNLPQGQSFSLEIFYRTKIVNTQTLETLQQEKPQSLSKLTFATVKEPLINEFLPSGDKVKPDSELKITFSEAMNFATVIPNIKIEPKIEGKWQVMDEKTIKLERVEKSLPKDTQYTLTISKGIQSSKGGIVLKEIKNTFKTLGKVQVLGSSPGNGEYYVSEHIDVRVEFDQEVDKASAQANFTINPGVAGNFKWENNTMIYETTQTLQFDTTYNINVRAGVKSVYGKDSEADFASSFTIRSQIVLFYIPQYYQPPGFACNIFTAKMVMAWKGHYADHVSLIAEMGYDEGRSGDHWTGNPYARYVGNSDGSWGYGVYYPPIQNILANRGIGSEPRVGSNLSELAHAVQQGHPVIVWRYNGVGGGQDISWIASDGSYVNAFNGMHGSVITGFIGSADNPSSVYVNDPWLGQFWMDAGTFDYYWSFSGRMSLIVY